MPDLSTTYMGLALSNPLMVGSSTLTGTPAKARALEEAGVGAVVLGSIFEEQIREEVVDMVAVLENEQSPEAYDYLRADFPMQMGPERYLDRIRETKAAVRIPVIASLNCTTRDHWVSYARKIEIAGADALELNVYDIPHDPQETSSEVEDRHLGLVQAITDLLTIPVSVKIGPFYTSLANFLQRLTALDVKAVVLFNRFFQPVIDVQAMKLRPGMNFSRPQDNGMPVRWIALLRRQIACDIAMTTGVHDAEGVLKGLLAGANAVQVCSALYENQAAAVIGDMLRGIARWMTERNFGRIGEFQGQLAESVTGEARGFARAQYVESFLRLE